MWWLTGGPWAALSRPMRPACWESRCAGAGADCRREPHLHAESGSAYWRYAGGRGGQRCRHERGPRELSNDAGDGHLCQAAYRCGAGFDGRGVPQLQRTRCRRHWVSCALGSARHDDGAGNAYSFCHLWAGWFRVPRHFALGRREPPARNGRRVP